MPPARLILPAAVAAAVAVPILAVHAQGGRVGTVAPRSNGTITSVTIQQRMIIRVPRLPAGPRASLAPTPPSVQWIEKKAPKCLALIDIAAAAVTNSESVDLILNGGKRMRANFHSDCSALDFYSGFYVKMSDDRKVCAGRDAFRSRSGGECRIKAFRTLVPKR